MGTFLSFMIQGFLVQLSPIHLEALVWEILSLKMAKRRQEIKEWSKVGLLPLPRAWVSWRNLEPERGETPRAWQRWGGGYSYAVVPSSSLCQQWKHGWDKAGQINSFSGKQLCQKLRGKIYISPGSTQKNYCVSGSTERVRMDLIWFQIKKFPALVLFSTVPAPIYISTNRVHRCFLSSTSSPILVICSCLFDSNHSKRYEVISQCDLFSSQ